MKVHPLAQALIAVATSSIAITAAEISNGTEIARYDMPPEFTVAGTLPTPDRDICNLNVGWRFHRGDAPNAKTKEFDDSAWEIVNAPHGLEKLPEEASGGINFRGVSWYRKHFTPPQEMKGKRTVLYFEGIMGKSEIYINGSLAAKNFGGYLPIQIDISSMLKYGKENIISVRTDNSDDASYPPGKPQDSLDFCYFGGIYRDVYLISSGKVFLTDANAPDGDKNSGIFVWTESIDTKKGTALVRVRATAKNESTTAQRLSLAVELFGRKATTPTEDVAPGESKTFETKISVPATDATLWSPDSPTLGELKVALKNQKSRIDSARIPFGIRAFELSDKGLVLNGKPFPQKLIGGNRHQDFAELGNAVPNNLQWQDAVKLRAAGMRVIRCAHYPMDPAFMDACDRLGLFVIVATPGWQFWNNGKDSKLFESRVYSDIKQMVRRDRNRPSVFMWEPILNESYYPGNFAAEAHNIVHAEYPAPSCYTACDQQSRGSEHYDVMYAHPITGNPTDVKNTGKIRPSKPYFCREFGDNVDSWTAHNSPSRVSREWGEIPMLIQSKHYLKPDYDYTCWDTLFKAPAYHIGGALWHPFDHQRGYHPDPFFGGIMDAFRQPKTSYYAFMSQRPAKKSSDTVGAGAMVKIAHAGTPFSPNDVTVFSNCDSVRLTSQGSAPITQKVRKSSPQKPAIPNEPIVFKNAWDFQKSKAITRAHREKASGIDTVVAEGIIGGKVVCQDIIRPGRRPSKISLELDNVFPPMADGSSIAVLVASIVDENGDIKRLNNEEVVIEILSGDASPAGATERKIEWGTAPFLIRAGTKAGEIKVRASLKYNGTQKPQPGTLTFKTSAAPLKMLFSEKPTGAHHSTKKVGTSSTEISDAERKAALEKVGADQAAFE